MVHMYDVSVIINSYVKKKTNRKSAKCMLLLIKLFDFDKLSFINTNFGPTNNYININFFSAAQNLFTVWIRNRFTDTFNFMIYILCNLCENRQPVEIFILSCIGYIQYIPLYFSQFYNKVYSSLFFTMCIQIYYSIYILRTCNHSIPLYSVYI